MNVYPFIAAEKAGKHHVQRARELFKVSRSAYYQQKSDVKSRRRRADVQLTERITAVHAVSKGTYGSPRIPADLADTGLPHGHKRVARLMRAAGLAGKSPRRWRTTTIPDPNAGKRPDLVVTSPPTRRGRYPLVRRHQLHQHVAGLAVSGHRHQPGLTPDRGVGRRRAPQDRPG